MSNNNNDTEARPMNDTTMPRTQKVSRRQERLKKGFGLGDWVRLTKSAKDLAMRGGAGLRRIPPSEVAEHDSIHDAWIILQKKVYNITPYLHYHPGGITILKSVLGKEATSLFDKYHPWVNIDGLIGTLLLGSLDDSGSRNDDDDGRSYLPTHVKGNDGFAVPAARPPRQLPSMLPRDEEEDEADVDPLENT
jgi:cytochrome-b5 reductase